MKVKSSTMGLNFKFSHVRIFLHFLSGSQEASSSRPPLPTAVIARGKTVLYHGRIDDRNPRLGARRVHAGHQDLREALTALGAGP